MRQVHRADEKAFVDFSGKRPVIYDATTGEIQPVELFVGGAGREQLPLRRGVSLARAP
jgi:transposase